MAAMPRALENATAHWKQKVCAYINQAEAEADADRGWKLLFALDLLIFDDLRDKSKELSKRRLISDRMELLEQGQWGWYGAKLGNAALQSRTPEGRTRQRPNA